MHVVDIRIAWWKIMWEYVHVSQVARVIHCWAVCQFNTVQLIINVHRVQFAKLEFVRQFVQQIVNVSMINYVYKAFVNRHVTTIQRALISNFVKIIFVHKRFDAELMMIAY